MITQETIITVIQQPRSNIVILPGPTRILNIGTQGPSGPAGSGSEITGICGANISIGTACVLVDGLLYPADPTNLSQSGLYVGVALTSGTTSQSITVAQLGTVSTSGLSAGSRYFVGLLGILSTTPIAVGANWMRYVGTAQSSSALILVSSVSVVLD